MGGCRFTWKGSRSALKTAPLSPVPEGHLEMGGPSFMDSLPLDTLRLLEF